MIETGVGEVEASPTSVCAGCRLLNSTKTILSGRYSGTFNLLSYDQERIAGEDGLGKEGDIYQIKITGVLDTSWSEWLGGMEIRSECGDQNQTITILTGKIADQAILRGILCKIWDLNFKVISITSIGQR